MALYVHISPISFMPACLVYAGSGYSWMQDHSSHHDNPASNGRKHSSLHSVSTTKSVEIASVNDLFDFICSGPLVSKTGLTKEAVAESIDKWIEYGSILCRLFQLNQLNLNLPQKVRIYHYYIPVFMWCEKEIADHYSKFKGEDEVPPLVVNLHFSFALLVSKTLQIGIEMIWKSRN